ncbi:hypothetical protein FD755_018750, partial [Muntiacus reevesi]
VKDAWIFGLQKRGIQSGASDEGRLLDHLLPHLLMTSTPQISKSYLALVFVFCASSYVYCLPCDWYERCYGSLWVLVSVGSCRFGWRCSIFKSSSLVSFKEILPGCRGKGSIYEWASGDSGIGFLHLFLNSLPLPVTPDLYGNCTLRPPGTSAAAPEAAEVFALALEANLGLTWRDMQHLTVLTPKQNQLHDKFDHLFGYRVLDAGAIVKMAKDSKTVPEGFHCVGGSMQDPEKIPATGKLVLTFTTDACEGKENFVPYLEHVQVVITVNVTRRGDLDINMTSPMGTKSILLSHYDAKVGFDKWPFMTTHTWGEDAQGTWTLELGFMGSAPQKGLLKEWTLMLYGTQSAPYVDQVVRDHQSKLAMSKKEELEEELDKAMQRSLKSILGKD